MIFNTILSMLGGACALGALVAAVTSHIKAKTAALDHTQQACQAYQGQDDKLCALQSSIDALAVWLSAVQEENTELHRQNETKDKRIVKLERDLSNALILVKKI